MDNFRKQEVKSYRKITTMAIVAFSLFCIVEILSYYRLELFGINPRYAPHNFAFNMGIYLPAHFIALIFSIFVFIEVLTNRKVLTEKRKTIMPLCLSAIIILIDSYFILLIVV